MESQALAEKKERLIEILRNMGSVLVAYSGGVDSSLLLKTAHDTLGDHVLAVTACSDIYPRSEIAGALELAGNLGVRHIQIETDELEKESFVRNAPDRCYHCKVGLFETLSRIAAENGMKYVTHGGNVDDMRDFRPGHKAAREQNVRAPLQEAGLTKSDIRELAREMGLPNWSKPSMACLASRFPYGTPITAEALRTVDSAEQALKSLGFGQIRVRHFGDTARIEIEQEALPRLMETGIREQIIEKFKELGYLYITVDLEGYSTGSMNKALQSREK